MRARVELAMAPTNEMKSGRSGMAIANVTVWVKERHADNCSSHTCIWILSFLLFFFFLVMSIH